MSSDIEEKKEETKKTIKKILEQHELEFESLNQRMNILEGQLNALPQSMENIITEKLNGFISALQGQQVQTQAQPVQGIQDMQNAAQMFSTLNPNDKFQIISGLFDGISKLISAWKSGGQSQSSNPLGQLGEQLISDLMRATVDDIQQRVYNIRKRPPPNVLGSSESHSLL